MKTLISAGIFGLLMLVTVSCSSKATAPDEVVMSPTSTSGTGNAANANLGSSSSGMGR